jgi:uncharacterized membrane protein YqiK
MSVGSLPTSSLMFYIVLFFAALLLSLFMFVKQADNKEALIVNVTAVAMCIIFACGVWLL